MQEMLPDYVLGRLDEKEISDFEYNLHKFPDIEQEVAQANELFQRINKTDFDKLLERKTRNMSYNVHNKLKKETRKRPQFLTRFALPTIGLVTVFVLMFFTTDVENIFKEREIILDEQQEQAFLPDSMFNEELMTNYLEIEEYSSPEIEAPEIEKVEDDIYEDVYAEENIDILLEYDLINEDVYASSTEYIDYFEYLSEEDFQIIYKEIKNEKLF